MRRRVGVAFVLVGLGGCGGGIKSTGPSTAPDTFTEGSRLKARWMQAPGTPRALVGWYDSQLRVNCTFSPPYDNTGFLHPDGGDFYCLPELTDGTGDLFVDAACTQPAASVTCPNRLAELPAAQPSCDAPDRFFPVGDPLTNATVFQGEGGTCIELPVGAADRPLSPYRLSAETPVTSFVHAHVTTEAGSARIARRMMTADDGSSQVWGAWDSTRGEAVYPPDWALPATMVGPGKWEPERLVDDGTSSGLFTDAGCTQPIAELFGCGSLTVKSVFQRISSDCTDAAIYFEAGAPVAYAQTYQTYPTGACLAAPGGSTPDGAVFVPVGAMIPPSSFADVSSVEEGTGRVRLRAAGTDAGAVGGPYAYYFDTQSGEMCVPGRAADDTLRCLPLFSAANLFSDAGCTLPVLSWSPGPAACAAAVPSMVNVSDIVSADPCGDTVYRQHVRPVGSAYASDVFTGGSDGQPCDKVPADQRATLQVYQLGAELPAGNFVALSTSNPF